MKNIFHHFKSLHPFAERQSLEWSVSIGVHGLENRAKPTTYVYPKKDKIVFDKLSEVLRKVDAPSKVLRIQEQSRDTAMYQGIRLPEKDDDKCLYIHDADAEFIHAYRWSEGQQFDICRYQFSMEGLSKERLRNIHSSLLPFFHALRMGQEYHRLLGHWTQEIRGKVHEIYLSFPSRPPFAWIIDACRPLLSEKATAQLIPLSALPVRNIGFDSVAHRSPKLTCYFSFPILGSFPEDHKDAIDMATWMFAKEAQINENHYYLTNKSKTHAKRKIH